MKPLTTSSRSLHVLWWLVCLIPPVNLLLALDSRRSGSADGALGGVFLSAPPMLAAVVLAPIVLLRGLSSDKLARAARAVVIVLALSVIPMYFLVSAVWWFIGWPERTADQWPMAAALTGAWVALAVLARRRLRGRPIGQRG